MGAGRFRWFHDYGCCECVASECLDFGKPEPLCDRCPLGDDDDEEGEFMPTDEYPGNVSPELYGGEDMEYYYEDDTGGEEDWKEG